jgi:predicted DNA-binding transcriptional regulator AlpA
MAKAKTTKTTIKKKQKPKPAALLQLSPFQIIRRCDAAPYFGYGHAQFDELIRTGRLPAPMKLSEGGKATGYTGQMIIDHQANLKQLAAAKKQS